MRRCLVLLVAAAAVLVASNLPAGAAVVALKRDAGLNFSGGGTYTDARFDTATVNTVTVADTALTPAGNESWSNSGKVTQASSSYALYKFDLSSLAGFAGGIINKAQLRLYHTSGNGGGGPSFGLGQIMTHDWIEGTKTGGYGVYPGAAGGASHAHPMGYNTGPNQDASGGYTGPVASWGVNSNAFFSPAGDGANVAPVVNAGNAGVDYSVFDVTAIVTNWASGDAPNHGFYQGTANWTYQFSEAGTTSEPVLFLDYTPTPEPATLALLALSGLALIRRRVNG